MVHEPDRSRRAEASCDHEKRLGAAEAREDTSPGQNDWSGSRLDANAADDSPEHDAPGDSCIADVDVDGDGMTDDTAVVRAGPTRASPVSEMAAAATQRCGGCGSWVAYRQQAGYDRQMREVAILQARCPTCGWQHTKLR